MRLNKSRIKHMRKDNTQPLVQEEAFRRELTRVQSDLFTYLCALTGRADAARDVLQDTNLALCRQADRYDPLLPFLPWARTIAYYQVLSWRKRQLRERLVFDDELLEDVADALRVEPSVSHAQLDALEGCVKKLPERMRELLEARYVRGCTLETLAASRGRASNAVAASLYRIRQLLSDCMEKALGGGAYVGR